MLRLKLANIFLNELDVSIQKHPLPFQTEFQAKLEAEISLHSDIQTQLKANQDVFSLFFMGCMGLRTGKQTYTRSHG